MQILAESKDESALTTAIPYLRNCLICFPGIQFTMDHLKSLITLSKQCVSSLQYDLYLVFHFVLNNWKQEGEDLKEAIHGILFAMNLPSDLVQSPSFCQDTDLITEVLQESDIDYYREYM